MYFYQFIYIWGQILKNKNSLHKIAFESISLIFLLIFFLSATSAATAQNASSGPYAYITNDNDYHGTVTVIDTATDTVVSTVDVGLSAFGVAVNPAGTKAYIGNWGSGSVSVIDTAANKVTATVDNVGWETWGVAVNQDGTKV